MKTKFFTLIFVIAVCLSWAGQSQAQDAKLIELRKDFALRYLQPDAHFALAKYYIEKGNFVQAFFILEYARRYRFDEKDFDSEYFKFFGDPMPEPPDDAKDAFQTATKLASEQKYDEAEVYYLKANTIYDKSFAINIWTGRFYFKTKNDSTHALPYYFKSYFLYPHTYETEYAEYRIRAITGANAKKVFSESVSQGKAYSELVRDNDPIIVSFVIGEIAKSWKDDHLPILVEALNNDDSVNRWGAFITLQKNAGTRFDKIVEDLLANNDLRKRGLAAYAVVERRDAKKFEVLQKMLSDPAELVRFDAVSALAMSGGAKGKQIIAKHRRIEKQPRLRALIDKTLQETPK